MTSFESYARTVDDPIYGINDGRPRVHLPPERAKVSLPPGPVHWAPASQNFYHVPSAPPNSMSYDQSFPSLGATPPQINIPLNPPLHAQYPSHVPHSNAFTLEQQMRNMILNNNNAQGSHNRQEKSNSAQYPHHRHQQTARQPDQSQWRQQPTQVLRAHHPTTSAGKQDRRLAPHVQGLQSPASTMPPPPQAYEHGAPRRKQLYDPSSGGKRLDPHNSYQPRHGMASVEAQIEYLDLAAYNLVPKVQMDVQEYNEKDRLRGLMENICRKAVFAYERAKNDSTFQAETIELKCFGSMSTTFATKSSDMDLVLVSPHSKPSLSAPESEIPRVVEKALLDSGFGARLLTKTRVPIIRFCEKPTPELADLLLKERVKYENERDAPPPSTGKSKKPKKKQDQSHPELKSPEEHTDHEAVTKPETDDTISVSPNEKINGKAASMPLPNDEPVAKRETNVENKQLVEGSRTERDDPTLLTKSDDERIRLYRLAIQEGWYEPTERKTINEYIRIMGRKDATEVEKGTARGYLQDLPNIIGRYRAPPEAHPLEFPKSGVGIQCDINFSNHLALHNSHMLKCYSLCDVRVRQIVIFVKEWAKRRKINSPYHGTLSSYGYVLMVLHYLINVAQPAVVPNLQRSNLAFEDTMSASITELDGHNIQFFRNEASIEKLVRYKAITRNSETVGSLLRGFFHYFAQQNYSSPAGGFRWSFDVLSLRTLGGLVSKQSKGWTGAKTEHVELKGPGPQQSKEIRQRYLFAVEDPFETEHNIARTVVHNGIVAIRDEFRRAHKLVENAGKGPTDLLAEAEVRENLQYRAFGPKPRSGPDKKSNTHVVNGDKGGAEKATAS